MYKISKKLLIILALLISVTLVLASCGKTEEPAKPEPGEVTEPSDDDKPDDEKESAEEPADDGPKKLVLGANWDPPPAQHGNPWSWSGLVGIAAEWQFDRLFEVVPDVRKGTTEYIPMLGESFEDTEKQTIIHLKKDVKWSDGTPFTSKDVLCTYYLGFIKNWVMWKYVDKIEAPDDYTVKITWREDSALMAPTAFANLVQGPYHIFGKWADQVIPLTEKRDDRGALDDAANEELTKIREDLYAFKPDVTEIVGTGPFTVEKVTASEAVLKKRDDAWCSDNVKFDELMLIREPSTEAYVSNRMQGLADFDAGGVTHDIMNQLKEANPNMRIVWSPEYSQPSMQFNTRKSPVDKVEVRKAIIYAIDRESLLEVLEPGTMMPDTYVCGLTPTVRDGWIKDLLPELENYEYNPQKAEEILTSIGWKKGADGFWQDETGQTVQLEVSAMNSWLIYFLGGEAITNQLNEFGLKTEFKPMEISAYWEYLDNAEHMISFDFRPGGLTYGVHPWEFYQVIYLGGDIRLGFKDPKQTGQIVDYQVKTKLSSGEEVDCVQLVNDLFYTRDRDKQVEIVKKLAEATNSLVPIMPIGEKTAPFKVYNEKLTYPEDPIVPEWYGGANDRVWLRQIKHGLMYFAD